MADFTSIDQNKLPGVKEVCRDFAVLEDHTLAHSLQEQEIESHLASNVHKSRLVQQDLQVAKRLQEEEDLRAKARIHRQHRDIEKSDNEIAQEIQEQLVKQAEQQRQQEEKDEAIARKMQEKEMKEERRRKKQLQEVPYEEEYYEEKGDRGRVRHPEHEPLDHRRGRRPHSGDRERKIRPESRSSQLTFHSESEERHRRDRGHRSPPHRVQEHTDSDRVVRRKERPQRPPPPQSSRDHSRERRKRASQEDVVLSTNKGSSVEQNVDFEDYGDRQRLDDEVFEEHRHKREERREHKGRSEDRALTHSNEDIHPRHNNHHHHHHPPRDTGRRVRAEYGVRDVTQGIARMDLREQELKDLEVARRLQEEELKASHVDKRAAQVAQDEEIARLLMEEEKKVYKKTRDREKGCVDKRRPEGEWKQEPEEVVRPRSREEYEYQKPRNHKPARPPPPMNDYENVDSRYAYPGSPCSPRPSTRPEAAYKGYRQ